MVPPAVTCAPNNPGPQETLFRTLTSYRGEGTIKRSFPQRVYNPVGSWTEVRNEETVSERSIRRFARRHLHLLGGFEPCARPVEFLGWALHQAAATSGARVADPARPERTTGPAARPQFAAAVWPDSDQLAATSPATALAPTGRYASPHQATFNRVNTRFRSAGPTAADCAPTERERRRRRHRKPQPGQGCKFLLARARDCSRQATGAGSRAHFEDD